MSYKDLAKVEYLPFGESVELIKNRQLDATLQSAGLGVSSIRDLATSIPVTWWPCPPTWPPSSARLRGHHVIPANTYNGQTADVPTLAVVNFLVTHAGVSDETVYQMTKQLFENLDQMVAAHAAAKAIKLETAINGMPLPLHPGAERYYREKGLIK
jgi:TRAP transporter TAXI family solute receptor